MAVRKLSIDIMSYLKGKGFEAVDSQVNKMKSSMLSLKSITDSSLFRMAAGYFTVNTLIGQYKKAVEANNTQIEHETKLYATLRAQNFREEQIESLKQYAGELQKVGIIGDEASLAGIRQLASFKLQEQSIRELLPSVHNLMVAEKGMNSTIQDGEKWSKALGIAVSSGQVRALKQAGVVLDEHTAKLFESANEQQRVAILVKELKERVGEQNAEFLKTPEGKIVSAQNRIGDIYEVIGGVMRETRGEFWSMIADNAEWLQDFFTNVIRTGTGMADTVIGVIGGIFNTFKAMPKEARDTIKLLTGFFLLQKFPIAGAFLVIEDIFSAFQGKESFTEDAMNAIFKFTGANYRFDDLRKDVRDFWHDLISPTDQANEKISFLTATLETFFEVMRGGIGLAEMVFGGLRTGWDVVKLTGKMMVDPNSMKEHVEEFNQGGIQNIKHGWKTLNYSADNMTNISDRYQTGIREKEAKELQEAIQLLHKAQSSKAETPSFAAYFEKPSMRIGNSNVEETVKALSKPRIPKERQKEVNVKNEKNSTSTPIPKMPPAQITITNKPQNTYHITGLDAKEISEEINKKIKQNDRENEQRWKAQLGGQFSLIGGNV